MRKKISMLAALMVVVSLLLAQASYAGEKEGLGTRVRNFWRNLLGYAARVTEESASVVADTGVQSVNIVTNEVRRVAEVTTGDVEKTKELVTEPITGTAQTAVVAVEGAVNIPSEAAKEDVNETAAETE